MSACVSTASTTGELVAELYRRHNRLVRSVIQSRVRHPDSEDLEQDVWLAALVHLPRFRGESKPQTWLVHIAINAVRMWMRRKQRWQWEGLTATVESQAMPLIAEAIDLATALNTLGPAERQVLIWHDAQGFTHREIALRLGIVKSTSVRRLVKARREFTAALAS